MKFLLIRPVVFRGDYIPISLVTEITVDLLSTPSAKTDDCQQ